MQSRKNFIWWICLVLGITLAWWPLHIPWLPSRLRPFLLGVLLVLAGAVLKILRKISKKEPFGLTLRQAWVFPVCFIALHGINYFCLRNPESSDFLIHLILGFGFFAGFLILASENTVSSYEFVIRTLIGSMALTALFLVIQYGLFYKTIYLSGVVLVNDPNAAAYKNTLAFFLSFVFPFSYSLFVNKRSLWSSLTVGLIFFSIIYTLSRMALLTAFLSMILFCIFSLNRKRYVAHLVTFVVLFFTLSAVSGFGLREYSALKRKVTADLYASRGQENSPLGPSGFINFKSSRVRLAQEAFQGWRERPFFGHGLASFHFEGRGQVNERHGRLQTHNDYLQLLYETGLVGFAGFVILLLVIGRRLLQARQSIPPETSWIYEGQVVCFFSVIAGMFLINVYHTIPFWFLLAGNYLVTEKQ